MGQFHQDWNFVPSVFAFWKKYMLIAEKLLETTCTADRPALLKDLQDNFDTWNTRDIWDTWDTWDNCDRIIEIIVILTIS